jgi:hypothetical protein
MFFFSIAFLVFVPSVFIFYFSFSLLPPFFLIAEQDGSPMRILAGTPIILTEYIRGIPQPLQENAWKVP